MQWSRKRLGSDISEWYVAFISGVLLLTMPCSGMDRHHRITRADLEYSRSIHCPRRHGHYSFSHMVGPDRSDHHSDLEGSHLQRKR